MPSVVPEIPPLVPVGPLSQGGDLLFQRDLQYQNQKETEKRLLDLRGQADVIKDQYRTGQIPQNLENLTKVVNANLSYLNLALKNARIPGLERVAFLEFAFENYPGKDEAESMIKARLAATIKDSKTAIKEHYKNIYNTQGNTSVQLYDAVSFIKDYIEKDHYYYNSLSRRQYYNIDQNDFEYLKRYRDNFTKIFDVNNPLYHTYYNLYQWCEQIVGSSQTIVNGVSAAMAPPQQQRDRVMADATIIPEARTSESTIARDSASVSSEVFTGGFTPLMEAARLGNIREIEQLIAQNVNPFYTDRNGRTAYTVANVWAKADAAKLIKEYEIATLRTYTERLKKYLTGTEQVSDREISQISDRLGSSIVNYSREVTSSALNLCVIANIKYLRLLKDIPSSDRINFLKDLYPKIQDLELKAELKTVIDENYSKIKSYCYVVYFTPDYNTTEELHKLTTAIRNEIEWGCMIYPQGVQIPEIDQKIIKLFQGYSRGMDPNLLAWCDGQFPPAASEKTEWRP